MHPEKFPESNITFARNQEEYRSLPAWTDGKIVISLWRLTWRERIKLLVSGKLWLSMLTYGEALQPQLPQVENPFKNAEEGEAFLTNHESGSA